MVIYLDDIVVYGTDPRLVWEETKVVLERLCNAGFMVNTKKSKFLVSSVKMLGFHLSRDMLTPNYARLEALVKSK